MTTDDDLVYLLDVNVLLALVVPQHVHHQRAHAWFGAGRSWASTAATENGLLRLLTQPAVMGEPVSMVTALAALSQMRAGRAHVFLADDASLGDSVISLERLASGKDVTDLHLVDLAARHGVVFATLDRRIRSLLAESDRRHLLVLP
jgi:toxin-antitoxin system PIN domain toxin